MYLFHLQIVIINPLCPLEKFYNINTRHSSIWGVVLDFHPPPVLTPPVLSTQIYLVFIAKTKQCIIVDGTDKKGFGRWRKNTMHPSTITKATTAAELLVCTLVCYRYDCVLQVCIMNIATGYFS